MWLDKLERKWGGFGIPRLMLYIVIGSGIVYLFDWILILQGGGMTLSSLLYFNRDLVMQGQIWRVITFVLVPPSGSMFFVLIGLYFYYFVGTSLESHWGAFRFTVYYLVGMIGSLIAGFITKTTTATYLNLSLFFAFAALFPDLKVLLFFVIPIKVKWLGLVDAAFFLYAIVVSLFYGDWGSVLAALMAIVNFLLFFGPSMISGLGEKARYAKSRREFQQKVSGTWNRT